MSEIKAKIKNPTVYIPAGFLVMALTGGITWGTTVSQVNQLETRVGAHDKLMELINKENQEKSERIIRLEITNEQILSLLTELRTDVKSLTTK